MQQSYQCPRCGASVTFGAKSCGNCQTQLNWQQQTPSLANNQNDQEVSSVSSDISQLERRAKSGASWFFWIAGISIINSIILVAGGNWHFFLGLGITDILCYVFGEGNWSILLLNILIAGIFVLFGVFGRRFHTWSFVFGTALYVFDGLILAVIGDWFPVGFHAFALIFICMGLIANHKLHKLID
jgi:hypothetical protein